MTKGATVALCAMEILTTARMVIIENTWSRNPNHNQSLTIMEPDNTWIAIVVTIILVAILIGCRNLKPKPKNPMATKIESGPQEEMDL